MAFYIRWKIQIQKSSKTIDTIQGDYFIQQNYFKTINIFENIFLLK
jgi:hypothetical protein